jgi:hypothetical protein
LNYRKRDLPFFSSDISISDRLFLAKHPVFILEFMISDKEKCGLGLTSGLTHFPCRGSSIVGSIQEQT